MNIVKRSVVTAMAAVAGLGAAGAAFGLGERDRRGPDPAIVLVKLASVQSYSAAGTTITYTFNVTNTGNVSLTSVTVTDPMAGLSTVNCGNGTPVIRQLSPGVSATCTATYTTTARDGAAGSITNVAAVSGTWASGRTVAYKASMTIPETGYPYRCIDPPFYFLSESQSHIGPTTLFESTTSAATYAAAPAPPYPGIYNAIGLDPTGPNKGDTRHDQGVGSKLIKIDDTGVILSGYPAAITGYPAAPPNPVVGAFDTSGNYWVTDGGGGTTAYGSTSTPPRPASSAP